jgi:hypothetical protein
MPYDFVNVSIQVASPDGSSNLSGEMTFFVSDFVWDTSTAEIVVVQPIPFAVSPGGFTGNPIIVPLLAMDNPTLNTGWRWLLKAGIPGLPSAVPVRVLTVNMANNDPNGDPQNLTDLLAASVTI